MLLKEINHTQCAIDQSHQVTAEGSLVSPAFFGQQDAETVATRGGHRSGSGTLCGVGNICLRNMEKPLFQNTSFGTSNNVSWAIGVPRAIL